MSDEVIGRYLDRTNLRASPADRYSLMKDIEETAEDAESREAALADAMARVDRGEEEAVIAGLLVLGLEQMARDAEDQTQRNNRGLPALDERPLLADDDVEGHVLAAELELEDEDFEEEEPDEGDFE